MKQVKSPLILGRKNNLLDDLEKMNEKRTRVALELIRLSEAVKQKERWLEERRMHSPMEKFETLLVQKNEKIDDLSNLFLFSESQLQALEGGFETSIYEELKLESDKKSELRRQIAQLERQLRDDSERLELLDIQAANNRTKAIADSVFGIP